MGQRVTKKLHGRGKASAATRVRGGSMDEENVVRFPVRYEYLLLIFEILNLGPVFEIDLAGIAIVNTGSSLHHMGEVWDPLLVLSMN